MINMQAATACVPSKSELSSDLTFQQVPAGNAMGKRNANGVLYLLVAHMEDHLIVGAVGYLIHQLIHVVDDAVVTWGAQLRLQKQKCTRITVSM